MNGAPYRRRPNALLVIGDAHLDSVYGGEVREALEARVNWIHAPLPTEALAERLEILKDVECLFTGWEGPTLNAALLAAAPRLRVVFYAAGTVRQLVTPEFWASGIRITTAAGANAIPVAEYALGVILLSMKRFWAYSAAAKQDRRMPAIVPPPPGNYRRTVGLVSLGRTGRLLAQRLRETELRVFAFDPYINDREARELGVECADLADVFAGSDCVSLHTPLLPETIGMIRREHFNMMKPGATFLNTARGAVVDEPAMIEVLKQRPDLTAVLDVTVDEPLPAESPLFSLPNVVLTPHIAGSLGAECRRLGANMVDEFDCYVTGSPLSGELTKEASVRVA